MPFCPKCKYEYVAGIVSCPDCDQTLVAELPVEYDHLGAGQLSEQWDGELVEVFSAGRGMEASIIRGVLQSSGIPVLVRRSPSAMFAGRLGQGWILSVPASLRDQAEEAIRLASEDGKAIEIEQPWGDELPENEEP